MKKILFFTVFLCNVITTEIIGMDLHLYAMNMPEKQSLLAHPYNIKGFCCGNQKREMFADINNGNINCIEVFLQENDVTSADLKKFIAASAANIQQKKRESVNVFLPKVRRVVSYGSIVMLLSCSMITDISSLVKMCNSPEWDDYPFAKVNAVFSALIKGGVGVKLMYSALTKEDQNYQKALAIHALFLEKNKKISADV